MRGRWFYSYFTVETVDTTLFAYRYRIGLGLCEGRVVTWEVRGYGEFLEGAEPGG